MSKAARARANHHDGLGHSTSNATERRQSYRIGDIGQYCEMLAQAEVAQFVTEGYVVIRSAFSPDVARECRHSAADQLGIDLEQPKSWDRAVVRGVPTGDCFRQAANAPLLLEAISELVDPDKWHTRPNLGALVVRFPSDHDPGDTGWHIDSSFKPPDENRWFVNYRSKQRALLLLCLLSDVGFDDAPSRLIPGSHLEMARLLAPAGEGGLPGAFAGQESQIPLPARHEEEPILATGSAGDVFVCHPFLVHAASWPHRGLQPRFVAQPPISMPDALEMDGPFEALSPVARAIRIGLEESDPLSITDRLPSQTSIDRAE